MATRRMIPLRSFLETCWKPSRDSSATLSLDGSTVLIQPESVAKLQDDLLVLDHGSVSVGTSKSFKVRVNCLTVVPVLNEWTQYEVTDSTERFRSRRARTM